MRAVLSNWISAYESIKASLQSFIGTVNLQGHTYQSAKNYSSQVLIPLLKGCILLDEAIKEACAKLPSEYRSQVDLIDLREDELREKIRQAGMTASRYEYLASLERQKEKPNWSRVSDLSLTASRYMEIERRLQEKLQKLLAFNSSSARLFDHIQPLLDAVNAGLRQANSSWNSATETFTIPSKNEMNWTETVKKDWEKKISKNEKNLYEQFKDVMDSDTAKRLSQLMGLLPNKFTEDVLGSDGLWEILSSVDKSGARGQRAVDRILKGLAKYEKLGKSSEALSKFADYLERASSPIKEFTKWGLGKISNIKALEKTVQYGKNFAGDAKFLGKGIKVLGKAGTVLTFASITYEGISGGVEEYSKFKDLGKAVGKGLLDAVASVGPLEGATIGAAIGGPPGAIVGAFAGGAIQIIKWLEPKFFDNPVKVTENLFNDVGKGIKNGTDGISKTFGSIGEALAFG